MKRYLVRLTEEAEDDLANIYRFVRSKAASTTAARVYLGRIHAFLAAFEPFPSGELFETMSVRDCGS